MSSKAAKMLIPFVLLFFSLGATCDDGDSGVSPPLSGKVESVQFYNCTHISGPSEPPSGRSFNMYVRVDGGEWIPRGELNPQPGDWQDCHDRAHTAASLTIDLFAFSANDGQKWEVQAIRVARPEELSCDSSAPDVPNACSSDLSLYESLKGGANPLNVDLTDIAG